jgi:putative membrane protein
MKGSATAVALDHSTSLAVDRTRLAHERTLMAWVRTGTSLISFGFTIYKFFDESHQSGSLTTSGSAFGSREFAIVMITIGIVAVALATVQHFQTTRTLTERYGAGPRSLALFVALLISVLGLAALVAVIFKA